MTNRCSYACKDYPGMEACSFQVTAESEDQIMKLIERHAADAHGEDPGAWSADDRAFLKSLIRPE